MAAALVSYGLPSVLLPRGDLLRDVHLRGAPDVTIVALTFDVLDALAEGRAPATFFLLSRNVDAGGDDDLLARMVPEGHTIGLHGYYHEDRMMVDRSRTRSSSSTSSSGRS